MKTIAKITRRQKEFLEAIYSSIETEGYPPTFEELKNKFNISSNQAIIDHLKCLEKKGFIRRDEKSARGINITQDGFKIISKNPLIPFGGTSYAGSAVESIELSGDWKKLSNEVKVKDDVFIIQISGDSMIDAGIFEGDYLLAQPQENFVKGDIVVAEINGKTTVKRFMTQDHAPHIYLKPENKKYDIILFNDEIKMKAKIIGKLEGNLVKPIAKEMFSRLDLFGADRSSKKITRKKTLAFKRNEKLRFGNKKDVFLISIKSTGVNKNSFKRYLGSPLRYAGGKSLAVGHIIQLLPDNIKRVVSPFIGGASVEIAMAKELGIDVIGYDIFDILTNYWEVQLKFPEKLYQELKKLKTNKKEYKKVKEILKKHWKKEIKLNKIKLAAYYYFNHNLSYGPGFLGWPSSVYLDKKRYEAMLKKVRNVIIAKLKVSKGDFKETIPKHKNDFMYLDPPYFLEGDSKMFRGIYPQRNFPIHHNSFDHKKLFELLEKHQGGFILSYNDCEQIRTWYKDYEIYQPSWQYTMGQGETRIGLNRIKNGVNHVKKSHELLICKLPK